MFCKSIRPVLARLTLTTRIRELLGVVVGAFFVAAGGCATHVTFHKHHGAGAAGMAGSMNSGGLNGGGMNSGGSGVGGRGNGGSPAAGGALGNGAGNGGK